MQITKKEIQKQLADLGIEVTLRPRKATLLWMLEEAKKKPSNVTFMDDIAEVCDPKKPEGILDKFMGGTLLVITKVFIAIIALEFVNASTLDLPPGQFFGVLGVLFLLIGIPLYVWNLERKYK